LLERTLVVGTGGFLGAAARYLLGGAVYRWLPASFPWATFVINVTGCFGIGFLAVLAEERMLLGPGARLFLMVGVLGGYTTFSTFGYETIALLRDGSLVAAALNVLGQVALGLLAVWAGMTAARVLP
jgi:fluoride exporter